MAGREGPPVEVGFAVALELDVAEYFGDEVFHGAHFARGCGGGFDFLFDGGIVEDGVECVAEVAIHTEEGWTALEGAAQPWCRFGNDRALCQQARRDAFGGYHSGRLEACWR